MMRHYLREDIAPRSRGLSWSNPEGHLFGRPNVAVAVTPEVPTVPSEPSHNVSVPETVCDIARCVPVIRLSVTRRLDACYDRGTVAPFAIFFLLYDEAP